MKESKGKEAFKKPFLILGLAFVALGCTLGFSSLAWFASPQTSASVDGMQGEATGSYFESGTGVESDPYIIANAKQLYYFAWLQDMGFFNSPVTTTTEGGSTETNIPTTYFKIKDGLTSINASEYVLPPVGIEKYPFVGNFDANNCTITGLTISNKIGTGYIEEGKYPTLLDTNNTRLTKDEFNSASQASIVGFFGVIGQYNSIPSASYDSDANEVKNLYLDEITIKTSDKSNLLIGIFAGYVNGLIDNCGVHYAKMDINGETNKISSFNYVSEYTLIGSYNKDKYSWDSDSGSGSGDGGDYGTSMDIPDLYSKLNVVLSSSSNPISIPSNYAIPLKFDSTSELKVKSGSTTVGSFSANYATTLPVASNATNIGYYCGDGIDVYSNKLTLTESQIDSISTATNSSLNFSNLAEEAQTKIKDFLKKTTSSGGLYANNAIVLTATQFDSNATRLKSWPTANYLIVDKQYAKVRSWTGNLLIPNEGIWVAPSTPGRFEFIAVASNANFFAPASVAVVRFKRSTPKDYSSAFETPNYMLETDLKNNLTGGMYRTNNQLAYYGLEVTQEDIDAGYEYLITMANNITSATASIIYLDIGSDAGSGSGTTTERTFNAPFDWVTKENNALTKIKNADGSEIEGNTYTKSEVFFEISDTEISRTFSWRRTTINEETLVLYYEQYTSTTATAVMSAVGSGKSSKAKDGSCEAKTE